MGKPLEWLTAICIAFNSCVNPDNLNTKLTNVVDSTELIKTTISAHESLTYREGYQVMRLNEGNKNIQIHYFIRTPGSLPADTLSPSSQGKDEYYVWKVEPGSFASATLPDGTNIWLNTGSCLYIAKDFEVSRKLVLFGEAYLEVKKKVKPLSVHIKSGVTEIIEGKINLEGQAECSGITIASIKGRGFIKNKAVFRIIDSDACWFMTDSTITTNQNCNPLDAVAWHDAILNFNYMGSCDDIFYKFEHWYNIVIDNQIQGLYLTGVLPASAKLSDFINVMTANKISYSFSMENGQLKITLSAVN